MAEEQRREDLLSTTDCLEAISVIKGWKNGFFILAIVCLILLQICFWLIDTGLIKPASHEQSDASQLVNAQDIEPDGIAFLAADITVEVPKDAITSAAGESVKEVAGEAAEANQSKQQTEPNKTEEKKAPLHLPSINITYDHIAWVIRVCNFALFFSVILYCLTILLSLKISLLGRLGGLNHITRAFFLSLIVVVFVFPWHKYFGGFSVGLVYSPDELLAQHIAIKNAPVINIVLYYSKYCAWWVLVMAVFILAQSRSIRWSKATLRRLGVI